MHWFFSLTDNGDVEESYDIKEKGNLQLSQNLIEIIDTMIRDKLQKPLSPVLNMTQVQDTKSLETFVRNIKGCYVTFDILSRQIWSGLFSVFNHMNIRRMYET